MVLCFCSAWQVNSKACDAALQDLRPLRSTAEAERMSTVEIELRGSLAGSCTPGDTVTCVGLVKVLKTESSTGRHLHTLLHGEYMHVSSSLEGVDVMVTLPTASAI